MRVQRFDIGTSLRKPERTPQGFLRLEGHAARTGIQEYPRKDGTIRREIRLDEDVFDARSMAGYEGASFVDLHPRDGTGKPIRVSPDNVKRLEVGTVTGARRDGNLVAISCVVKDPETIASIERRDMIAISVGYAVDLDETPGVHPVFGRYDAIQRNIVVNHVARVPEGRAGDVAKFRVDDAMRIINPDSPYSTSDGSVTGHGQATIRTDVVQPTTTTDNHDQRGRMDPDKLNETIRQLNSDLKSAETREGAAATLAASEKLRADTAEGRVQTLVAENTELRAKATTVIAATATEAVAAEKLRADEAEKKLRGVSDQFGPAVRARAKLERQAMVVLGDDFRMDDLDDRQIRTAVVTRLDSTADVGKEVSDGVIVGRFLSLLELRGKSARSLANVAEIMSGATRVDEARVDADVEKKRADFRDQWKQPLPNSREAQLAKLQR